MFRGLECRSFATTAAQLRPHMIILLCIIGLFLAVPLAIGPCLASRSLVAIPERLRPCPACASRKLQVVARVRESQPLGSLYFCATCECRCFWSDDSFAWYDVSGPEFDRWYEAVRRLPPAPSRSCDATEGRGRVAPEVQVVRRHRLPTRSRRSMRSATRRIVQATLSLTSLRRAQRSTPSGHADA